MKMKRIQCSHRLGYFWCSVFLVLGIFGPRYFWCRVYLVLGFLVLVFLLLGIITLYSTLSSVLGHCQLLSSTALGFP